LGSRFEERIYELLSLEPVTPSEGAKKLDISHKTALRALMHLALTREDVHYKNSGRIHLFWIEAANETHPQETGAAGTS